MIINSSCIYSYSTYPHLYKWHRLPFHSIRAVDAPSPIAKSSSVTVFTVYCKRVLVEDQGRFQSPALFRHRQMTETCNSIFLNEIKHVKGQNLLFLYVFYPSNIRPSLVCRIRQCVHVVSIYRRHCNFQLSVWFVKYLSKNLLMIELTAFLGIVYTFISYLGICSWWIMCVDRQMSAPLNRPEMDVVTMETICTWSQKLQVFAVFAWVFIRV